MIQGNQKEHSHGSQTEQGRNLGGSVGRNIGKTKRTKRTISTIRMMEQGQATWRGFGPSCSGKSGSTGMDPGRTRKGRKRNFCLEIHQQGFMSVTERNSNSSTTASSLTSLIMGCKTTCAFFHFCPDPHGMHCVTELPSIRHLSCWHIHSKHAHHSPGVYMQVMLELIHKSQEQPVVSFSSSYSCHQFCLLSNVQPHTFHFDEPTPTFSGAVAMVACNLSQPQKQ